jgi:glycine betaine transporter
MWLNQWILDHFDWLFSSVTFFCVLLVIIIYLSPIGKVKIGGSQAIPLLNKWKWFSITLCTTIATGILLWGAAEPLYHVHQPPANINLGANIEAARDFAMSTMYMHWTVTPYSIYTIAALMFALMYYNKNQPLSVSSCIYPIIGKYSFGFLGTLLNVVCLFALVAGMAGSLGGGILTIAGGMNTLFGTSINHFTYAIIGVAIVLAFTVSSASGLMKGIKLLSDFNIKLFIGLSLTLFFMGPTMDIIGIGWSGFKEYIINFMQRSMNLGHQDEAWQHSWTIFYWANWLAWTPITAVFLGKISRGYTVRQFIHFNLLLPSLFSALWMMIFSGSSLFYDLQTSDHFLYSILQDKGAQNVVFAIFNQLPIGGMLSIFFLFITFLSFVTAADSNTSAMSSICTKQMSNTQEEAPIYIKISWGVIIGFVAWIMISYAGIDGLKIISTIGGFPTLFFMIIICLGFVKLILNPKLLSN